MLGLKFEYDIFKKKVADNEKLLDYGFKYQDGKYIYKVMIMDNFEVIVTVLDGFVSSKIMDLDFNEEYINYRLENQNGAFVCEVREKYLNILNDICDRCFIDKPFISNQANRINNMIYGKYGDKPQYKWEDNTACVYENNGKWYGIVMCIDRSKIADGSGEIEVINVKLDKNKIINLLKRNGFYKAYHMNKKYWISIILDDSLSDDEIFSLIEESHSYTVSTLKSNGEWVMPINPGYFDVFNYFDNTDLYYWDKKRNFKKDDIIYLYITKPVGSIMYKCKVEDITDDFLIVRRECKFDEGKYSLDVLKKYGLTSVRSTRHIPLKLSKYLEEMIV